MLSKNNKDKNLELIHRIAQIGVWRIVKEYRQCLNEIERYAKIYVKEYLSECDFCSWSYEDNTAIAITYKRDNEERFVIVGLEELIKEGLENTYLC